MLIARGTRKGQTDRPGKKTAKRSSGKGGLHDVRVEVRHDTQCTDLIKDLSGQTTNNGKQGKQQAQAKDFTSCCDISHKS